MTIRRPLIGVSSYDDVVSWHGWEHTSATLVAEVYLNAVWEGGGTPVLLPSMVEPTDVVDRMDAVILVGGPDVGADRYGVAPHELAHPASHRRDEFELGLIDASLMSSTPLLGICRGAQLLNVARRGTLVQHIPELLGHEDHSPGGGRYGKTRVRVLEDSQLAGALGTTTIEVDCLHHQAIGVVGDGLDVTAWAEDGTIEAIEDPKADFLLGVQWHPEEGSDRTLFAALAAAAEVRRARKR